MQRQSQQRQANSHAGSGGGGGGGASGGSGGGGGGGRRSYNRASNSFKFHNFVFNQDNQSFCLEEQHGNKKITVLHWKKSDAANNINGSGSKSSESDVRVVPTSDKQVPATKKNHFKLKQSGLDDYVTPAFPILPTATSHLSPPFETNVSKSFTNVTKLRNAGVDGIPPSVVSTSASFPPLYSHATAISVSPPTSGKSPFSALLLPRQSSSSSSASIASTRQSSSAGSHHLLQSSVPQFPLTHNFNKSQNCLKEMISKSNNSSSSSATNFSMSSSNTSSNNPQSQSQLPLNLSLDNLVLSEISSQHRRRAFSNRTRRKPSQVRRILLKKSNQDEDDEDDFIEVDGGSNTDNSDDDDEFDENEDDNMSSDRDSLHSYKTYLDQQIKYDLCNIENKQETLATEVQSHPLDLSIRRDHNNNSKSTSNIHADSDIDTSPIVYASQHPNCDFDIGHHQDQVDKEDDVETTSVDDSVDSLNSYHVRQHDQFVLPYCFSQIPSTRLTEPQNNLSVHPEQTTSFDRSEPSILESSGPRLREKRRPSDTSLHLSASTSDLLNPFMFPLASSSFNSSSHNSFLASDPDLGSTESHLQNPHQQQHHRQHQHNPTHSYMFDTFLEEEIYKILQSNSMSAEKFDDKSIRKSIDEKIEDKLRSLREEILSGKGLTSTLRQQQQHSGLESNQDHFKLFKHNVEPSGGTTSASLFNKSPELWSGSGIIGGNRMINSQANSLLASKSRLSQRSQIKRQLEDAFKQNGFLVKVSDANNSAMFCKFRQLRKYTRYYLKSWQNHLPDEVNKLWKGFLPPMNRNDHHPSFYHLSPPPSFLTPTSPTSSNSSTTSTSKTAPDLSSRAPATTSGTGNNPSPQSSPFSFGNL